MTDDAPPDSPPMVRRRFAKPESEP